MGDLPWPCHTLHGWRDGVLGESTQGIWALTALFLDARMCKSYLTAGGGGLQEFKALCSTHSARKKQQRVRPGSSPLWQWGCGEQFPVYTCLLCGQLSPAGISTCAPRLGQASFQNQFTFLFSPKEVLPPGPRPGCYIVALGGLVFCFLLYFSGPAGLQLATRCICAVLLRLKARHRAQPLRGYCLE